MEVGEIGVKLQTQQQTKDASHGTYRTQDARVDAGNCLFVIVISLLFSLKMIVL